jgi:ATP-binding cassette subfamily F protein 3
MRRISTGTLPGFPPHICVAQVQQELPNVDNNEISPLQYIVENEPTRKQILKQIDGLENIECDDENVDVEEIANMLESLYDIIEDEGIVLSKAIKILKDLGFSESRRTSPMSELSGGWKMRVSIAMALVQAPDILLLDEPTNHLDVEGVTWLKGYILGPGKSSSLTVLVTSHDKKFLDDICSDIIRFHKQHLHYYVGNYSQYEITRDEKSTAIAKTQSHVDKQRKSIEESVQKMQINAAKSDSSNGMIASRKKKLLRLGAEKNIHGHKFNAQHEMTAGRSTQRAGSMNETAMGYKTHNSRSLIDGPDKESVMKIPNPLPLNTFGSFISIRNLSIGYSLVGDNNPLDVAPVAPKAIVVKYIAPKIKSLGTVGKKNSKSIDYPLSNYEDVKVILKNITLDIDQKSKIAIVGKNGCGKTTFLRLLIESETGTNAVGIIKQPIKSIEVSGNKIVHNNDLFIAEGEIIKKMSGLKIAYYQQHLQDALPYDRSPLSYMTEISPLELQNEQLVRGHLGSFGLSGDIVNRKIGTLSGGQKSRIVLAQLTWKKPNLLLLDEPTNNLDLDAVKALGDALKLYEGTVLLASHDMSFVKRVTDKVYHLEKGKLSFLEAGVDEFINIVDINVDKQRKMLA